MDKPKVIVLWGKGQRGKTTTLNLLIEKLISSGAAVLRGAPASNPEINCWVILEYQGRKIGIITAGDDEKTLDYYFRKLCIRCDVYICASRTKGSSCQYIKNRFQDHLIVWQEKWSVGIEGSRKTSVEDDLRKDANEKQVKGLIRTIDTL